MCDFYSERFLLVDIYSFYYFVKRYLFFPSIKLYFYVDMTVWSLVSKQYYILHMKRLGGRSTGVTLTGLNVPASTKRRRSRARVAGSHET